MEAPTFLKSYRRTFLQKLSANILRQGQLPKHIGIIMDGNRRYAKAKRYQSPLDGHREGDHKLSEVCQMLVDLNIPELTVYFFSLENFKRTHKEVEGLMHLITQRMKKFESELEELNRDGNRVEVIGDLSKASSSTLRNLFSKVMWSTKDNRKFKLNIAFAYTGQSEIASGLNSTLESLLSGEVNVNRINENLVDEMLTIGKSNPVDIIIRTGGDSRLSDFMLWTSSKAYIAFLENVAWPEFNNWHLLQIIFRYQIHLTQIGSAMAYDFGQITTSVDDSVQNFLVKRKTALWKTLTTEVDLNMNAFTTTNLSGKIGADKLYSQNELKCVSRKI